jgi:4-hydroxybenzoyl-CoA reductase subunit alpha
MSEYAVIGQRLPRIDGPVKATGEAQFTADISLPGMLHGRVLRSPFPHARILSIDTRAAHRVPGVKAVVTGADTPGRRYGIMPATADEPALAIDRVRYIGEGVAAVAAVDEEAAEEACSLIRVEYEPLPAVFDPVRALEPGAPQLHERAPGNLSFEARWHFGDVEEGLAQAHHVREDHFELAPTTHVPLEPHVVLASFDSQGHLTVWAPCQNLLLYRRSLSLTLGLAEANIRVVKPHAGGGFGGKVEMYNHDFCAALLSHRTGRPVKIVLSREEVFTVTRHRHPMLVTLKTGVDREGRITAVDCQIIADGGAYTSTGPVAMALAGLALSLAYRVPRVRYHGRRAYTNTSTSGPQRGHGGVQGTFALDCQLDMIAADLGLDPLQLRLRNAHRTGDWVPNGFTIGSSALPECIEGAARQAGWGEAGGERGVACCAFVSGNQFLPNLPAAASIKLELDGAVHLLIGAPDIGQGSDTVLAQIAAEELGVNLSDIRVTSADTALTPIDAGAYSSRVTFFVGRAVKEAASRARERLIQVAARALEANPQDVEGRAGRFFVRGSPDRGLAFRQVVKAAFDQGELPLLTSGTYRADMPAPSLADGRGAHSPAYSFATQIAEVRVDRETGQVEVAKMTTAHDCGRALNPMAVEGQVEGGNATGLGQALGEALVRREGQVLNPNLLDYKMPTALDMPAIDLVSVESPDPEGPFGAKESGEGIQLAMAPAIANALFAATGSHPTRLPILPQQVLAMLEQR